MRSLLFAALALCCGHALAQPSTARCDPAAADAAARAVRAVLDAQAAAWNSADLDAYMAGYAQTDSLRFASGGNLRQGWEAALAAYRAGYTDAAAMGRLTFSAPDAPPAPGLPPAPSPIHITPLCDSEAPPRWALAFGRWHLARAGEAPTDAPHGLFTLLVEKRSEGWRVVHDHTSLARKPAPEPVTTSDDE
jgi:ketosteroid isomerase-like protein